LLPFLKNKMKQGSGIVVKEREPDEAQGEDIAPDTLEDCVKRLKEALKSDDIKALVEAIRDVHDELHMEMNEKQEEPE